MWMPLSRDSVLKWMPSEIAELGLVALGEVFLGPGK